MVNVHDHPWDSLQTPDTMTRHDAVRSDFSMEIFRSKSSTVPLALAEINFRSSVSFQGHAERVCTCLNFSLFFFFIDYAIQ